MTVRVRGIYATALTTLFEDVVQASSPINDRFEETIPMEPAAATVEATGDRQGIGIHGQPEVVAGAVETLQSLGRDTLVWRATLPRGAVFAGEIDETLGSGAIVRCLTDSDVPAANDELAAVPLAGEQTAFLPYSKTPRRVEEGDRLRVQVTEPRPPWDDGRPVLDTTIRIEGGLATLVRGRSPDATRPTLADIVPVEPPSGWELSWEPAADDASLDELADVIESLGDRAESLDESLADIEAPDDTAPQTHHRDETTCWVWFGRGSRFALDERRNEVTPTMPGHHRIKAATGEASAAVDFVEALCAETVADSDTDFPFDVVTRQFGPREGDRLSIGHGKPNGSVIDLGPGEVTERTSTGQVTVCREMSSRGTYDALGTQREPTDVAVTKFKEGRWWYPTIYRGESGESKGTYVNICTPVEVFPSTIRYVDLHVDVIKRPDGTVTRVDDDDLDAAVAAGEIPTTLAEKARSVARAVESAF